MRHPSCVKMQFLIPGRKKGQGSSKLEVDGVRNGQAFAAPKRPKVITSCLRGEI